MQCWKLNFDSNRHFSERLSKSFTQKDTSLPKKNLHNDSQTTCFFRYLVITEAKIAILRWDFLFWSIYNRHKFTRCLVRIADQIYCFGLIFIINFWHSLEISPHFGITKQLKELLKLPNSHISVESRHWSQQLVGKWKTDIFSINFQSSFYWKIESLWINASVPGHQQHPFIDM